MDSIITQFYAYVRQFQKFSMGTKFEDFSVHWSIVALNIFKENQLTNSSLMAIFVRILLRNDTYSPALRFTLINMFRVFKNRASLLAFNGLKSA